MRNTTPLKERTCWRRLVLPHEWAYGWRVWKLSVQDCLCRAAAWIRAWGNKGARQRLCLWYLQIAAAYIYLALVIKPVQRKLSS